MKTAICNIIFYLMFTLFSANAQEATVEIVEVKDAKRITFFAINHTEVTQEIFFKVDGTGFRKSSYRPVIKKVPAGKKVLLTVLIPLKNVTPEYTYFSSVDEKLQEHTFEMQVDSWKKLDALIDQGETIIFTKNACTKCEKLIELLKENRIKHKAFDISENKRYRDFFWNTISKMKRRDVVISSIPIAIVKGKLYEGLDLNVFVESLKAER